MAHGVVEVISEHGRTTKMAPSNHNQPTNNQQGAQQAVSQRKNVGVMGSRRIFAAAFKLKVLDSYRNDIDCRGNQRATARKYGIHRRQIQKWLQCEDNLRSSCAESNATTTVTSSGCCEVPVGSGGVSTSPGLTINGQSDATTRCELNTTSASSTSLANCNGNNSMTNCTVITSVGIAPSPGAPITTPAALVTAAPALNLSLARLHGDEQQHRQAPPAHHPSVPTGTSIRHSLRRASSPLQYLQHNDNYNHQVPTANSSVSSRAIRVNYENTSQQETALHQRQNHHRQSDRFVHDSSCSSEVKYSYGVDRTNYKHNESHNGAGLSRSTNSDGYYQSLESYRKNNGFVGFGNNHNNNNIKEIGSIDESFLSLRDRNVNEAGSEPLLQLAAQTTSFASSASSSSSSLLVLHATTIKSERASPDSLATPGPCEIPGSPESAASMPRSRHYNDHHQHRPSNKLVADRVTVPSTDTRHNGDPVDVCTNTRNESLTNATSAVANAATGSAAIAAASVAVRTNDTTSLAHVHVGVDSHASDSRVSEKREREIEHQRGDSVKVDYEERMRRRVKEEVAEREQIETAIGNATEACGPTGSGMTIATMTDEPKVEMSEEIILGDDSGYYRESTGIGIIASCPDYQVSASTPTGSTSEGCSGSASPIVRDSAGTYSSLSSPRATSSSGISTSSSCSDSEIDPLDYSSNSTRNAMADLSRRRSFSLRFKLDVLDAFHGDVGVAGNQRATARKFGINRRQVQKWLGQESELRGEIALRGGDLRQRLGPMPEINSESSIAVDLRTSSSTISSICGMRSDAELEHSSPPLYCCDVGSSSHRYGYYRRGSLGESPEVSSRPCPLSCCMENLNGGSMMCYQESTSQRRSSSGYPESQGSIYCYSPSNPLENGNEEIDVTITASPLKRSACTLTCCYDTLPSPKRICSEGIEKKRSSPMSQDQPPQEVPLCLVKPKRCFEALPMQTELVTSTVPTPPAQHVSPPAVTSSTKKDAILFKPYLDNPVSKPTEETHLNYHHNQRGLSPVSAQTVIVNNNNNCHGICNLNDDRTIVSQHDYALQLSLRVPVSWRSHHGGYGEFPERLRSAFVRYPTIPHYT